MALLSTFDPDEISDAERKLISNLRLSHTRRLLLQLVALSAVSMDAWFDYAHLLFGELKGEVEALVGSDPQLRDNYDRFIRLWGAELGDMLQKQQQPK